MIGVGLAVAAVGASAAAGAFGGGSPPAVFGVQINGVNVPSASYQIGGATIPGKGKGGPTQSYKVKITAPVSNDTTLLQAFRASQIPGDVVITLYDATAQEVVGYDFSNAAAVSYQQTGDHGGTFEQELVFTSSSLTVS